MAKREMPKLEMKRSKPMTLSEASRAENSFQMDKVRIAHQKGFVEGMELMYQIALQSVSELKGVGKVRFLQIESALKAGINDYAKKIGVKM